MTGPGPEPDPPSSRLENSPAGTTDDPARDLHRLRDELEKRWVEGEAVHHVVRAAADAIRRGPRAQEGLDILDDVAVVIPQADVTTTCDASTSLPLSPAQNKWISEVVEAIHKAMAEAWDRREERSDPHAADHDRLGGKRKGQKGPRAAIERGAYPAR